jgi:hypothetical protein
MYLHLIYANRLFVNFNEGYVIKYEIVEFDKISILDL